MTLSSSSDFEASKIRDEGCLVTADRNAFLDEFFSTLSPVTGFVESAVRSFLLRLPPETAHDLTLRLLPVAASTRYRVRLEDERLRQRVLGINFPNPVGVAA